MATGEVKLLGKSSRRLQNGTGGPENGDSPILVVAEPAVALQKDQRAKDPTLSDRFSVMNTRQGWRPKSLPLQRSLMGHFHPIQS